MRLKNELPELLAPAGSPEAFEAAINAGADAVYLGGLGFNARQNARNFTADELKSAVADAHAAGVKVYLTLNTLVYDREIRDFLKAAETAYLSGADALIVADIGGSQALLRTFPDFPLHASTQMSVHNTEASVILAEHGFKRAVLARELSRANIRSFVDKSPLEAEIFVHGALCMCHSGQCLFSSVVGGRSGNRGECAQPCRLPYGTPGGRHYPLSPKDNCLANHVTEIIDDGVASLKIEGRMKPADYVGGVVSVWRSLLDERRNATPDEIDYLSGLFSRTGFTDGYYVGKISADMLGTRTEEDKQKTRALKPRCNNYTAKRPEISIPKREHSADEYKKTAPSLHRSLKKTGVFTNYAQLTETASDFFDDTFVPLFDFGRAVKAGKKPVGVIIPPVVFDSESGSIRRALSYAAAEGAKKALVANLGHLKYAADAGLEPVGDFRLNITNNESAAFYESIGFRETVLSPELTLPRIRDIGSDTSAFVYGRIPLMITEKCAGRECGGCRNCGNNYLVDRMGKRFPVIRAYDHRSIILNCIPTYMSDRRDQLFSSFIKNEYWYFTTETPDMTDRIIRSAVKCGKYPFGTDVRRIQQK